MKKSKNHLKMKLFRQHHSLRILTLSQARYRHSQQPQPEIVQRHFLVQRPIRIQLGL